MKSYIRSLMFRMGIRTAASIVSTFAKIAEDLEALTDHHLADVSANQGAITALAATNDALLEEVRKASAAAANVRVLLGA